MDPNRISLGPRRIRTQAPAPSVTDNLPQLWDPALDSMMGRTVRAYELVYTYARDCPTGTRWSTAVIAEIREQGRFLRDDIHASRYWQRKVAEEVDLGEETMNKFHDDAEAVQEMCERVQEWITSTERIPRGQRLTVDAPA